MFYGRQKSARGRLAGVTVPLFSLRTERSWALGDLGDLGDFARWIRASGVGLIQLLPLGPIGDKDTSPYAAMSAFGIDAMYIAVEQLPELRAGGVRAALWTDMGYAVLQRVRNAPRIDYELVRWLKNRALRFACKTFLADERGRGTPRDLDFEAFCTAQRHWLEDFVLFCALKLHLGDKPWWEWPTTLRDRVPESLQEAREHLAPELEYQRYLQWVAHTQWYEARAELHALGMEVMGDLPFIVGRDSVDVWARREEFRHDKRVGVPPDQFDEQGQDWGMAPYRWDGMRANDFAWLRRRARYAGALFDRFRIDHVVGFYRTYMRPMQSKDAEGFLVEGSFDPRDQRSQLLHGERVLEAMLSAAQEQHAELIAEDLGTVPDFVRSSLTKLVVPGYKVLIWEKDGEVFRDPRDYPECSVACFGTHDTASVSVWWKELGDDERTAVCALPALQAHAQTLTDVYTPETHTRLLHLILGAKSNLVLLLLQDILAVDDRINVPSTVGPHNWSWRLAKPISALAQDPTVNALLARVRSCIAQAQRGPAKTS